MAETADNSLEYYRNRERLEMELAKSAISKPIQTIHLEMANRYREIIDQLERPSRGTDLGRDGLNGSYSSSLRADTGT